MAASESSVQCLKAELSKAEVQTKELSSLQQALEQAEQGKRALAQDWQKEQASLERQLQAAGKNRDQLSEQVLLCAIFCASRFILYLIVVHVTASGQASMQFSLMQGRIARLLS